MSSIIPFTVKRHWYGKLNTNHKANAQSMIVKKYLCNIFKMKRKTVSQLRILIFTLKVFANDRFETYDSLQYRSFCKLKNALDASGFKTASKIVLELDASPKQWKKWQIYVQFEFFSLLLTERYSTHEMPPFGDILEDKFSV